MRYWRNSLWAALGICALVSIVDAGPINVPNFSFEAPDAIDSGGRGGSNGSGAIPGWFSGPSDGWKGVVVFDPTDFQFSGATGDNAPLPGTAHGGQSMQIAVGYNNPDIIWIYPSSSLGTVTPNSRYVLTVAVGGPMPWAPADVILSLMAGPASFSSTTIRADDIPAGTFWDYSTSFVVEVGNPIVGLPLNLELRADRAGRPIGPPGMEAPLRVDFDNIRLTSEAVPEPAHLWMLGGFTLVVLVRRRHSLYAAPCVS